MVESHLWTLSKTKIEQSDFNLTWMLLGPIYTSCLIFDSYIQCISKEGSDLCILNNLLQSKKDFGFRLSQQRGNLTFAHPPGIRVSEPQSENSNSANSNPDSPTCQHPGMQHRPYQSAVLTPALSACFHTLNRHSQMAVTCFGIVQRTAIISCSWLYTS